MSQLSKHNIRLCTSKNICAFSSPAYFDYKEDGAFPKPPSYNVATTLPSYDEAERTKAQTSVPLVTGRVSVSFCLFCMWSHSAHTHTHCSSSSNTSCVVCEAGSAQRKCSFCSVNFRTYEVELLTCMELSFLVFPT